MSQHVLQSTRHAGKWELIVYDDVTNTVSQRTAVDGTGKMTVEATQK